LAYAAGRLDGLAYRLAGRQPDPNAGDDVLADRIRSNLGRVERRLDIPHVHVLVNDGAVLLHGDVPSIRDVLAVVAAAGSVPGVTWVESRLHVGLLAGDTRPSAGRASAAPSKGRRLLVGAASEALGDVGTAGAERLAAAVVGSVLRRLPPGERAHVLAHLAHDVLDLVEPCWPEETGVDLRTEADLVERARMAVPTADEAQLHAAVRGVVDVLRRLVPEEAADVAAVLPTELAELWEQRRRVS
jgi:uncharacterized protein (DUF2267 family)